VAAADNDRAVTDMSDAPLWKQGATEIAALFATRSLSPVELLTEVRERIDSINPFLNAIVALDDEGAITAARESEARWRRNSALGPLDGIPITVKENLLAKGLPATWGSRLFADHQPESDELPVARLRAKGAVILGKTNAPELTLEGFTSNLVFGTTRNPWDTSLTPGGSSGGAAASVAAGLTPLALATDGGGSIRRPAAHTGLVGVKPSIGWVARGGGFPSILLDFEVVGPLARCVRDAAVMLDAMAGPDPRDRKSLFPPASRRCGEGLDKAPDAQRILFVPKLGDNPVDPAIDASVRRAAETLEELGHHVEEGALPFDVRALNDAWPVIAEVGVAFMMHLHAEAGKHFAERFIAMGDRGSLVPAHRYLEILELIDGFRRAVADTFRNIDVIMTPSIAALSWPADIAYPETINGQKVGPRGHAVFTGWVNACGHPAVNLPTQPAPNGLPIGFQMVGGFGSDTALMKLAAAYEQAANWHDRWPELALG